MTELYDALENCLEALERGASLDQALTRYPALADQLRPLLAVSLMARSASRLHVPADIRRRGRVRLLQKSDDLSQSRRGRSRIISFFPRMALTGMLVGVLALTSTGLVSASSSALPGQQLYPVKRTWESLRLWLVFNPEQRDVLESTFEQERLDETYELLGLQESAPITFSGLLARRSDGAWQISGIPVAVTASTRLPAGPISVGAPVTVSGTTRPDGSVEATEIRFLQPGSSLPPLEPSENQEQDNEGSAASNSGTIPVPQGLASAVTPQPNSPRAETQHISYQFSGVLQSMQGSVWRINGQSVYVDAAQISGTIQVGAIVRFQGYYSNDGRFIVTTLQAKSSQTDGTTGDGGSGGSVGSGGSGGSDGSGGSGGGGDPEGGDDH
jgi:uncharacterized protein DUF5666/uncharacterized protein DUF5667